MDNGVQVNRQLLMSSGKDNDLGIIMETPKFPGYAVRSKREDSFKNWPAYLPIVPADLVEAGLVYTGVGDSVRCYHCGGGLRNWEAGDNPMLEHAKWYPKCPHVLLVKGQEYIDAAGRGEDMDVMQAANNTPSKDKSKHLQKPDIKCIAAHSCIEMGCSMKDVQRAMKTFCDVQGHANFKARDLLEIIIDNEGTGPDMEGATNVIDSRPESFEQDSDTADEETIQKMYEENRRIKESQTCKICLEDMAAIIFLPCGHLVACPQCAPALMKCPVCRLEVKGQVKARFA